MKIYSHEDYLIRDGDRVIVTTPELDEFGLLAPLFIGMMFLFLAILI